MSVRLLRRPNGFGLWLAIVCGSYGLDAYWEPINVFARRARLGEWDYWCDQSLQTVDLPEVRAAA